MKKVLTIFFFIYAGTGIYSQPINMRLSGDTYALIVGISKYQDIDTLQFAHRDALAFAQYLMSPAGGSLPADHVNIKINETATAAEVELGLDWLLEKVTDSNKKAIIYFSGHGDVENKTIDKNGFLLTYNTPKFVYTGALSVQMLNSYIRTISARNAQVILILDACRAGDLAGKSYNGSGIANEMLTQRIGREIRLMSCQPSEFSIEGKQWGNGRGAFSYHLIEGLIGLADVNPADGNVTLKEIRNYLEEKVPEEALPNEQNPVIKGEDINLVISRVDAVALSNLKRQNQIPLTAALDDVIIKGFEDELLKGLDTGIVHKYLEFKRAIQDKNLTNSTNGQSAFQLFSDLLNNKKVERLHSHLKRKMVAALMDRSQTILNNYIQGKSNKAKYDEITESIEHLHLAAEILGKEHYLYNSIVAKQLFLEATIESSTIEAGNEGSWDLVYSKLLESIRLDSNAAMVYNQYGMSIGHQFSFAKGIPWYLKAVKLAPQFGFAYYNLAYAYYSTNQYDSALVAMNNSIRFSSIRSEPYNLKGLIYFNAAQYDSARFYYLQSLSENPDNYNTNYNLGLWYDVTAEVNNNDAYLDTANYYYRAANEIDPWNEEPYLALIINNSKMGKLDSAIYFNRIALDNLPENPTLSSALGWLYNQINEPTKAIQAFKKGLDYNPGDPLLNYRLAKTYSSLDSLEFAIGPAKMAIRADSQNADYYELLSDIYARLSNYNEGINLMKQASGQLPGNARIWHMLANFYFMNEDYVAAIEPFTISAKIDSQSFRWYNVGLAYEHTSEINTANKYYWKALIFENPYEEAISNLYYYYLNKGENDSAWSVLTIALGQYPDDLGYNFWAARYHTFIARSPSVAQVYYDRILKETIELDHIFYETIALHYGIKNDIKASERYFKLALQQAPDSLHGNIYYNQACSYSLNSMTSQALKALKLAFVNGYTDWSNLDVDKDLDAIRNEKKFKKLVDDYRKD